MESQALKRDVERGKRTKEKILSIQNQQKKYPRFNTFYEEAFHSSLFCLQAKDTNTFVIFSHFDNPQKQVFSLLNSMRQVALTNSPVSKKDTEQPVQQKQINKCREESFYLSTKLRQLRFHNP